MLRLSEHLKQDVVDSGGARQGRLRDLTVRLQEPYPRVSRLLVGRAAQAMFVPWDLVASFERSQVVLSAPRGEIEPGVEEPADLLLGRDVLDCQIIDVENKRVARVGEVELAREGDDLRCVAVDTGLAPIARRFGLRMLADRLRTDAVAWENIHFASGPGHRMQLQGPASSVHRLTPEELMHLVGRLTAERGAEVLEAVPSGRAAGALSAGRPGVAARLLRELRPERASEILARMPVDDAATALRELEAGDAEVLLGSQEEARATRIRELLAHADRTAGAVMTPDVRTARVGEAVEAIRERLAAAPPPLDGLLTVVVIDARRRPHGVLPASQIFAGVGEPVDVPAVRADAPLDTVMERFATYDVLAVPVVDAAGVLVGVVAIDDILDVLLAEHLPGERRYRVMDARRRAPA
jgi:hypothetical protein